MCEPTTIAAGALAVAGAGMGGYQIHEQREQRKEMEKRQEEQSKLAAQRQREMRRDTSPGALQMGSDRSGTDRQRGLGARRLTIPLGTAGGGGTGVNIPQ